MLRNIALIQMYSVNKMATLCFDQGCDLPGFIRISGFFAFSSGFPDTFFNQKFGVSMRFDILQRLLCEHKLQLWLMVRRDPQDIKVLTLDHDVFVWR